MTFLAFATLLLLAEFGVMRGLLRLGRQLEVRFRAAFGAKVPGSMTVTSTAGRSRTWRSGVTRSSTSASSRRSRARPSGRR